MEGPIRQQFNEKDRSLTVCFRPKESVCFRPKSSVHFWKTVSRRFARRVYRSLGTKAPPPHVGTSVPMVVLPRKTAMLPGRHLRVTVPPRSQACIRALGHLRETLRSREMAKWQLFPARLPPHVRAGQVRLGAALARWTWVQAYTEKFRSKTRRAAL
jgi:hypothetical protein